jgi:hypothetical protein
VTFNESTGLRLMRAMELQTEAELCAIEGKIEDALELLTNGLREAEGLAYGKPPMMILGADLMARQGRS